MKTKITRLAGLLWLCWSPSGDHDRVKRRHNPYQPDLITIIFEIQTEDHIPKPLQFNLRN